ncbi:MAG: cobalt-precorrin 5A hydrolase [Ezakiella sp.]|nr:cobalt-precorrin 5A hydrolase [Ezakiella sp.]
MKIAMLAFTDGGYKLAKKIGLKAELFFNKDKKILPIMPMLFRDYDALVFISATGIAVRYIAKYIKSKDTDPAVIVIDEAGKFTISLLSGHIGGANELARAIAKKLKSTAVITTASDVLELKAIDLFAMENNLIIDDLKQVAAVMARIVEGRKLYFYSELNCEYEYYNKVEDYKDAEAALIISSKSFDLDIPTVYLRPINLIVGIGCKRGKSFEELYIALKEVFELNNLSLKSIRSFNSIDIKKDELGLIELANFFNREFKTYSKEELLKVEGDFKKSDFVCETVGVDAVSSRAALIFADELLVDKYIKDGITISISKIK